MPISYDHHLISRAKSLRREATPQERRLWYCFLKDYPIRFQRQKSIGHYIVDFYCFRAHLVIEIDGSQHYELSEKKRDDERTKALEQRGLKVIRFSNREINLQFDAVCEAIDRIVTERIK